jgi:hypothetical protein
MSAVYSAGVKATAIAAIKAAINARIVDLPDGTMDLDRESLEAWLRAEFDSMVTDLEATSASYVAGIDCKALVAGLNQDIRKEAFMGRADWPKAEVFGSPAAAASALYGYLADLRRLSGDITDFYADTATKMLDLISGYIQQNVLDSIPKAVTRQVSSAAVIQTWVTDRGEESAPGPASALFDRDENDTLSVTVPAIPTGRTEVTHFRLYMAASSSSAADYLLIPNPSSDAGWPVSSLTVNLGVVKDASLQEPCPSTTWEAPPADLRNVVSMGNGIHVGYSGNTIMPCEPYKPYAFPPEYRKTTSFPITGMCALDRLLVVGTQGPPKILSGADSASLTEIRHNSGQACVSARSMVVVGDSVIYASPDGLVQVSASGGVRNITGPAPEGYDLFSLEDWGALTPASIFAAELEGSYLFHVPAGYCYCLDPRTGKLTKIAVTGSTFYRDQITDRLYMAVGATIISVCSAATYQSGIWKSKLVVLPKPAGFAWLYVQSEFSANVTVRLYKNGTLFSTKTVTSRTPVRIESGRDSEWEVEIESTARITEVLLASTSEELRAL